MYSDDAKSRTTTKQIRPEYSISPDDDLYSSPRSWAGPVLQSTEQNDDDNTMIRPLSPPHRPYNELPHRNNYPRNSERPYGPYESTQSGSFLPVQLIGSLCLVLAVLFISHSSTPLANRLKTDVQNILAPDYTQVDLPASLARAFGNLPSSGTATVTTAATPFYVVAPIKGSIVRTFSVVSPEVVFQGHPGATVVAAAEGLVDNVGETQANGYYVTIDHGGLGQTFYAHLGRIAVHAHEYVVAGQTIGFLPENSSLLTFGYIRGGSYKDPATLLQDSKP